MPNLYSLGGKLVSKEEYEKAKGIKPVKDVKEIKPEVKKENEAVKKNSKKTKK